MDRGHDTDAKLRYGIIYTIAMDNYTAHKLLHREFVATLGYCNRGGLPEPLIRKLAAFYDLHGGDSMTSYYTNSLLNDFYRKRSTAGWRNFLARFAMHLEHKSALIEVSFSYLSGPVEQAGFAALDDVLIWQAIDDCEAGYDKANRFGQLAHLLSARTRQLAYQRAVAMEPTYRVRALGGLFPYMGKAIQQQIVAYMITQWEGGISEAAYQLKSICPYMSATARSDLVAWYLAQPEVGEGEMAFFLLRNVRDFSQAEQARCVERIRLFHCDYLRIRCTAKLADFVPPDELAGLIEEFMQKFHSEVPSSEQLHNFYQLSRLLELDHNGIIAVALDKIDQLDDSQSEYYNQQKYQHLSFLTPHLNETSRNQAYAIAATIRGGYRKNMVSRLNRHFAGTLTFCYLRGAPICY